MAFIDAGKFHEVSHRSSDTLYGLMPNELNMHLPVSVSSPTKTTALTLADRNFASAPAILKASTSTPKEATKANNFDGASDENFSGHASSTQIQPAVRRPKRREGHLSETIAPLENKRMRLMDTVAQKSIPITDGRRVRRGDFAVAAAIAERNSSMFGPI
ncbi:hypothetical protein BC830DRAFT_517492 [Chytriomyces sp. MP71]|nr:hypothetical protein BC830DRAFT_517492 [Chytriomyces sp. MP71]